MVRWLEANGYDVSYITRRRQPIARGARAAATTRSSCRSATTSTGPAGQRANVEAARDAGVNLAFFSGNEIFWKTRWENSIDGSDTPYRTLVCYKETHANAKIDPIAGRGPARWRDPRFSPPADGGRPENALTGTIFMVNDTGVPTAIAVPAADGKMRFWRNTSVATLAAGQTRDAAGRHAGLRVGRRTSTTALARRACSACRRRRSRSTARCCRTTARPTAPAPSRTT